MGSDPYPSGREPDAADVGAAEVTDARIEDEMEQSYIDYAMSVIAGRALPDARDGLKPVHRRILYAMHEAGVTSGASHRKSSSIVGETMGDYHPHGDSAIYDALARMAQDFSMRYPLVDGQGNFGSVDGDPPAAMRYTEARMAPIAEELLTDIDADTVDFTPNYDDRLEEPAVLPAAYPNLLVNGASGIAVGMSTNVPPHNLGEVIDATIHLINSPDCTVEDLMEHVEGPDFPTGANIVGRDDIYEAYKTGRGRLRVRAEFEVDAEAGRIVITELPYQQNKSRLVERIAEDVTDGEIEGVRDLRDESDRDGIRVVVELTRDAIPEVVKNQLLERHLERTFGVINLALVDGTPTVLDLKESLVEYLDHRREVVRRRSRHELTEAREREHVLEGRLRAVRNADDVVETIRDADDRDAAKAALREAYGFSERQAEHVVAIQLGSLTAAEAAEIESELDRVRARITRLETILADEDELLSVIESELREIKREYADERRTEIVEDAGSVTHADLIPEEECVVLMTEDDYVKRMPLDAFRTQRRGGKGVIAADLKEGDAVSAVFAVNSHDYLLAFTDAGQVYRFRAYEIPESSRTARGNSAVNLLDLDDGEELTALVNVDELGSDEYLTMVTRDGRVKRTAGSEFENILSTGIRAIRLADGDELVDVEATDGDRDVVIGTHDGMAIRFGEAEVRPMGRDARGVRGIDLEGDDEVIGIASVDESRHSWVLTLTANGYGKRSDYGDYRLQSRAGKGLIDIKTGDRNGPAVRITTVGPDDQFLVATENGKLLRSRVEDVSVVGRNTMGVTAMELEEGDAVTCTSVVPAAALADGEAADEDEDEDEDGHADADDTEDEDAGPERGTEAEPEPEATVGVGAGAEPGAD
jgi:DNA gyrase subunit A